MTGASKPKGYDAGMLTALDERYEMVMENGLETCSEECRRRSADVPQDLKAGMSFKYIESDRAGENTFWGGFLDDGKVVCIWGVKGYPPSGSRRVELWDYMQERKKMLESGGVEREWNLVETFTMNPRWFDGVSRNASEGFRAALEGMSLREAAVAGSTKKPRRL